MLWGSTRNSTHGGREEVNPAGSGGSGDHSERERFSVQAALRGGQAGKRTDRDRKKVNGSVLYTLLSTCTNSPWFISDNPSRNGQDRFFFFFSNLQHTSKYVEMKQSLHVRRHPDQSPDSGAAFTEVTLNKRLRDREYDSAKAKHVDVIYANTFNKK